MNAASPPLYANDVSPEFLRALDKSPFTEQPLAGLDWVKRSSING